MSNSNNQDSFPRKNMNKVDITPLDQTEGSSRKMAFSPSFGPLDATAFVSTPRTGFDSRHLGGSFDNSVQQTIQAKQNSHDSSPVAKPGPFRDVPVLPDLHPLERTTVFAPHSSASEVSLRVSEALRDLSIEAVYEVDKAKVKCLTSEGVDFRVRLYRGRGRFNHGIIVEVQRRFGTSLSFHSETIAILDAAEGKSPVPPPPTMSSALPLVSDSEDDFQPKTSSSMQMVAKMLNHGTYDTHHLALQTLTSLTDGAKVGATTAKAISEALFQDDSDVGSKVLSFILDNKAEDTFKLRAQSMIILANAIQAVNGNIPELLRDVLRPVLLIELRSAAQNPRVAFQAARCVEYMLNDETSMADVHSALEIAVEAGTARHAGLMRQAQRCLEKIR